MTCYSGDACGLLYMTSPMNHVGGSASCPLAAYLGHLVHSGGWRPYIYRTRTFLGGHEVACSSPLYSVVRNPVSVFLNRVLQTLPLPIVLLPLLSMTLVDCQRTS